MTFAQQLLICGYIAFVKVSYEILKSHMNFFFDTALSAELS